MTLRQSLLWLLPIAALSGLSLAAVTRPKPLVEPGLQVAKNGDVLEEQTRQPIAGAYVVVRWLEESRAGDKVEGQCLSRTVVRTDEHGHYVIPAPHFSLASEHAETRYFWDAHARAAHPHPVGSPTPGSQALEPIGLASDHAAPEQRVGMLADTLSRFS